VCDALVKGDSTLLDPFCNTFNTLIKNIEGKVNDAINGVIGGMLGGLKASISIEALMGLFDPLDRVKDIVKGLFNLLDGTYIAECLKTLIEEKKRIVQAGPESAERNMDDEEWEMRWKISWTGYDIYWAGRDIYWGLWSLLSDLLPIADLVMAFAEDWGRLHDTTVKKISYKFGDYLHGAINDKHDTRSWEDKVNGSIIIGWERGVKHFVKHLLLLVRTYVHNLIKAPIESAVQKLIIPLIEETTKPLADNLPPPCDTLINIPDMVQETISRSLDNCIYETLDAGSVPLRQGLVESGVLAPMKPRAPAEPRNHHHHDSHSHDQAEQHHHQEQQHSYQVAAEPAAAAADPAAAAAAPAQQDERKESTTSFF